MRYDTVRLLADKLSKRFIRRLLFKNLSFELQAGQQLAITGANGSGKSTLLRILAGVMRPTDGAVYLEVDGNRIAREFHPRETGFVAPYLHVYDGLSARENLAFIARVRRLPNAAERIRDLLDFTGLAPRADDLVQDYSSGMKQRVKVCAALLSDSPVLLLDEPTSNLDAAGVAMIGQVMTRQIERGGVVILATNNEVEADWCEFRVNVEDFLPSRARSALEKRVGQKP